MGEKQKSHQSGQLRQEDFVCKAKLVLLNSMINVVLFLLLFFVSTDVNVMKFSQIHMSSPPSACFFPYGQEQTPLHGWFHRRLEQEGQLLPLSGLLR